jgi:hypothetical protein
MRGSRPSLRAPDRGSGDLRSGQRLAADFEADGRAAIERCRLERPDGYVRLVASLLPKQKIERLNPLEELTDEELDQLDACSHCFALAKTGKPNKTPGHIFPPTPFGLRTEALREAAGCL